MKETKSKIKSIYQDLFENSLFPIYLHDLDGRIVESNKATSMFFGYKQEELIGKECSELALNYNEFLEKLKDYQSRLLKGKRIEPFEFEVIKKDNTKKWVCAQFSLTHKEDKSCIQTILQDISKRKKTEEDLAKERYILERIIDLNPYAICISDSEGYTLRTNKAHADLFIVSPPPDYSVFKDQLLIKWGILPELEHTLRRGETYIIPHAPFNPSQAHPTGPDRTVWISTVMFPLMDSENKLENFVIIYDDITKMKEYELELEKSKEKLSKLNKELEKKVNERTKELEDSERRYREAYKRTNFYKELFTHDIRNILQVLNSSFELFIESNKENFDSKEFQEFKQIVKKQMNRGKKLIDNVQKLAEIEKSKSRLKPVYLYQYLNEAINNVKAFYREKDIQIQLNMIEHEVRVMANEFILDIFENVLINAVNHNENSIYEISIKVSRIIENNTKFLKMEFFDNGIGISDERKKQIFESIQKRDNFDKGMGVGLSLVSNILKLYEGKIWVENRIKNDHTHGSNFIILIPEMEN
ncbi:MAG: PAS domain-containing sensor histidine kinase [Promethearchaeota archaeon]